MDQKIKQNILIVDDEYPILKLFTEFLKKEDLTVHCAQNFTDAIKIIKELDISLVLLDVYISGNSGIDLLPKIKEISPETAIVMISGMSKVYDAVEAMKRGAVDYLTKPVRRKDLLAIVRKFVEKHENQLKIDLRDSMFIGKSDAIKTVLDKIEVIAPTNLNVLILGKSGTGKEVIARMIHNNSNRKDGPFIAVDCGAIPENLIENEFFGSVKGSYTGAEGQIGKFELANKGTIFLDEITNLPISSQAKLLRVLQERVFYPLGSKEEVTTDIRIIATSNVDFDDSIKQNKFRDDLYYRLNEIFLQIPELKERDDDVILIADYFLSKANEEFNKKILGFSDDTESLFKQYSWPGNVRELKHIIFTAVLYCQTDQIVPQDLSIQIKTRFEEDIDTHNKGFSEIIKETERKIIVNALEECHGNKSDAAKKLKMHRKTLYRKIEDLSIEE